VILNLLVKLRLPAWGLFLVVALVAQRGPNDVDAMAGEGEDGLAVSVSFRSFAVIEGSGRRAALNADRG
jgi:hypothetical protein